MQDREAEKRKKLQDLSRQFYWDEVVGNKPRIVRLGEAPERPESAALGVLTGAIPLPKSLEKNSLYEVSYIDEYPSRKQALKRLLFVTPKNPRDQEDLLAEEAKYQQLSALDKLKYTLVSAKNWFITEEPKRVTLEVDKNGGISPQIKPSPADFDNVYTQVIRAYTIGLGVNRLVLDYPVSNGDYRSISLKEVMRLLEIAEAENAAVRLGGNVLARLGQPKTKKEQILREKIFKKVGELDAKQRSNTSLITKQAETASVFNIAALEKAILDLKTAGETLANAKTPEEVKANLKIVEDAQNKVAKLFQTISQDMYLYPSEKINVNYGEAVAKAKATVTEAKDKLDRIKAIKPVDPADAAARENVKTALTTLETKADQLIKQTKVESDPAPLRKTTKTEGLKGQIDKLGAATEQLREVMKDDSSQRLDQITEQRTEKLNAIQEAMKATGEALTAIKSEVTKADAKQELGDYQAAVTAAEQQLQVIEELLEKVKGHALLEEKLKDVTGAHLELTGQLQEIVSAIKSESLSPAQREEAKINLALDDINASQGTEKHDLIDEGISEVQDRLINLDQERQNIDPNQPESAEKIGRLASEIGRIDEYKEQLGSAISAERSAISAEQINPETSADVKERLEHMKKGIDDSTKLITDMKMKLEEQKVEQAKVFASINTGPARPS